MPPSGCHERAPRRSRGPSPRIAPGAPAVVPEPRPALPGARRRSERACARVRSAPASPTRSTGSRTRGPSAGRSCSASVPPPGCLRMRSRTRSTLPYDSPMALVGAALLAGRLGARRGPSPDGPARRAAGRLGADEPGDDHRGGRADDRRGDAPDHRLPQRPGLPGRAARPGRPDRLRGPRRRVRAGRLRRSSAAASARASPAGSPSTASPLLVDDANDDPARARRSRAPTTSTSRCSSSRCATTSVTIGVITLSKLGPRPVRRRRPAAADDPRRPGRDRRRDRPAC